MIVSRILYHCATGLQLLLIRTTPGFDYNNVKSAVALLRSISTMLVEIGLFFSFVYFNFFWSGGTSVPGNTKEGSITVLFTSSLTGLESAV